MTTILVGGTFHMALSLVLSIVYGEISYFNPISLLGFGPLFPQLLDSLAVTILLWAFLIAIGFGVLLIQRRRKVSVAIILHHDHKQSAVISAQQSTNEET